MKITDIVAVVMLGVMLLVFSIEDIRKKSLCIYAVAAALIVMLLYSAFVNRDALNILLGMIPGAVLAVLSFFSDGKVGLGDAFVFGTVGVWCGLTVTLSILFVALLTCAVTGIVLMIMKKATRKTALPFVPFVFLGYFICEIAKYVL